MKSLDEVVENDPDLVDTTATEILEENAQAGDAFYAVTAPSGQGIRNWNRIRSITQNLPGYNMLSDTAQNAITPSMQLPSLQVEEYILDRPDHQSTTIDGFGVHNARIYPNGDGRFRMAQPGWHDYLSEQRPRATPPKEGHIMGGYLLKNQGGAKGIHTDAYRFVLKNQLQSRAQDFHVPESKLYNAVNEVLGDQPVEPTYERNQQDKSYSSSRQAIPA